MELALSEVAIRQGFRVEKGRVVKYSIDAAGNLLRRRKNWANSYRAYSRQFIKDNCENCKTTFDLTIHHIVPLSKGGSKEEDNCQTLCRPCHDEAEGFIPKKKKRKGRRPFEKQLELFEFSSTNVLDVPMKEVKKRVSKIKKAERVYGICEGGGLLGEVVQISFEEAKRLSKEYPVFEQGEWGEWRQIRL